MTASTDEPPAGLHRSDPSGPGLSRRRRGRGWSYHHPDGTAVRDPAELARIKALVIPPAWQDVWISPDPDGHIQAVGRDAAGRLQYRYHDSWQRARAAQKYDRVLALGGRLPEIRRTVAARLDGRGLGPERILSAGVRMLDKGVFRAGGEEYAPGDDDEDGTFGLATLRRDHVRLRRGAVEFSYPAKGGIERAVAIRDPALHRVVNSLLRRHGGGEDLLAYRVRRDWHDVTAEDLNGAVKELAGDDYTCKDLRTWNATVLAAVRLAAGTARDGAPGSQRARRRVVKQALTEVSEHLGNTPTVARSSYVDPRVLERFEEGRTVLTALRRLDGPGPPDLADDGTRAAVERAVVRLLRDG